MFLMIGIFQKWYQTLSLQGKFNTYYYKTKETKLFVTNLCITSHNTQN